MRQVLLHLALVLLAVVAFSPGDTPPSVTATTIAASADRGDSDRPLTALPTADLGMVELVADAGLPTVFVAIARCESYLDPKAVHLNPDGSKDHGLWQINDRWWEPLFEDADPYNPVENAAMAAAVYAEQGLDAWAPSRPCWDRPARPVTARG